MKYAIIKCVNGAFTVDSEYGELTQAKVQFHTVCRTLWNSEDVLSAKVVLVDEQLNVVEDYREFIHHEQQTEPEQASE